MSRPRSPLTALRLMYGFFAGFLATIIFHQLALALLVVVGISPFPPLPMGATEPFGVPAVLSLAFWGGVWGIGYAVVDRMFPPGGRGYWVTAFLFGAIFPTLVALLVVIPAKGGPLAGGWNPWLMFTAFIINGVWGLGTGLILTGLARHYDRPPTTTG